MADGAPLRRPVPSLAASGVSLAAARATTANQSLAMTTYPGVNRDSKLQVCILPNLKTKRFLSLASLNKYFVNVLPYCVNNK